LTDATAFWSASLTLLLSKNTELTPPPASSSLAHHCCQADMPLSLLSSSPVSPDGLSLRPPPPPVEPPVVEPPPPVLWVGTVLPLAVAAPLGPQGMLSITIVALSLTAAVAAVVVGCLLLPKGLASPSASLLGLLLPKTLSLGTATCLASVPASLLGVAEPMLLVCDLHCGSAAGCACLIFLQGVQGSSTCIHGCHVKHNKFALCCKMP